MEELDNIPKKSPYSVPDGYFDNFSKRLKERMEAERNLSWYKKSYNFVRPHLALAAAVIGFILISYTGIRLILNNNNAEMTIEDIAYIIDDISYDVDDDILISTMVEEEIDIEWINASFESEDIFDYLSDDDLELTDLEVDF